MAVFFLVSFSWRSSPPSPSRREEKPDLGVSLKPGTGMGGLEGAPHLSREIWVLSELSPLGCYVALSTNHFFLGLFQMRVLGSLPYS